jgi:hypothetical protein
VRVILTAGVTETLDEARTKLVEADGTLRKPFEASALLAAVRALAEAAGKDRPAGLGHKPVAPAAAKAEAAPAAPFIAVVDSEQVRAAVTVALDAAMGAMVEEIARRVLATLNRKQPDGQALPSPMAPPAVPGRAAAPYAPPAAPAAPSVEPRPAVPPPGEPRIAAVRRVTPLRLRTGSILGLDISRFDPSPPSGGPETPGPEE